MSNTSRMETCEIADDDLDSVAGGLSVSGIYDVTVTYTQSLGGMTAVDSAAQSAGTITSDIPLGVGSITV